MMCKRRKVVNFKRIALGNWDRLQFHERFILDIGKCNIILKKIPPIFRHLKASHFPKRALSYARAAFGPTGQVLAIWNKMLLTVDLSAINIRNTADRSSVLYS